MAKKISLLSLLLSIFSGRMTKEEKDKAEEIIENRLSDDYEKYLQKPPEYHDTVIKRMYRKTKHANEPPEVLRDILHEQITGQKRMVQ